MADENGSGAAAAPASPLSGDDSPVDEGYKQFVEMLVREGRIGVFFQGENAIVRYASAEIDPEVFRRSVHATAAGVLRLLAQNARNSGTGGGVPPQAVTDDKIDDAARSITDAVCLVTYLKIRSVNLAMGGDKDDRYILRPRGITNKPFKLPLPLPFAAAISRLGAVEVRDLTRRMVALPAVPADAAEDFLLEPSRLASWSPSAYARGTVAFAKSLGMQFTAVDVDACPKPGTAWWLLKGSVDVDGHAFSLRCVLPESNYTDEDAIVHSMFCLDERLRFGAALFRLDDGVAQADYGSLLRNPYARLNVNAFLALCDEPLRSMWKVE